MTTATELKNVRDQIDSLEDEGSVKLAKVRIIRQQMQALMIKVDRALDVFMEAYSPMLSLDMLLDHTDEGDGLRESLMEMALKDMDITKAIIAMAAIENANKIRAHIELETVMGDTVK